MLIVRNTPREQPSDEELAADGTPPGSTRSSCSPSSTHDRTPAFDLRVAGCTAF